MTTDSYGQWIREKRRKAGLSQEGLARVMVAGSDLPRITFHGLRHTGATMMLSAGVHPKIASTRLGHSSIGITMDLYSHALIEMQEEASDRLDAILGSVDQK